MRQAAFVIIKRDTKILLVRSNTNPRYALLWGPPGGVVEVDEPLQQAAQREAVEETAIYCTVGKQLSTAYNGEGKIQVHVFEGVFVRGEINIDVNEIEEARWLTINEALLLQLSFNTKELLLQMSAGD